VFSHDHYVFDMGAAWPTSFKLFDVMLTNDTVYVVFQDAGNNFMQTINIKGAKQPQLKEAVMYYRDIQSCGRVVTSAQLIANTNAVPDINVEYENGVKSIWTWKDNIWSESNTRMVPK